MSTTESARQTQVSRRSARQRSRDDTFQRGARMLNFNLNPLTAHVEVTANLPVCLAATKSASDGRYEYGLSILADLGLCKEYTK